MSGHDHSLSASATGRRRKLAIVLGITVSVMVAEIIGAAVSGSLALLADAGHMLTDAVGLTAALVAASLVLKPVTAKRTWGFKRVEIIAAAGQASLLLAVGGYILYEGVRRLIDPPDIASGAMLWFGIIGLAGNVVGLMVLASGRNHNLNMKAAFLEVLNDALGSVAVIISAVVIATTGWTRADALVSLLIGAFIIPRALVLLRDSLRVLMETTPLGLDLEEVHRHILDRPHVIDVHDLHASRVDSDTPVLTAHVTVEDSCMIDGHAAAILADLQECVAGHFDVSIEHSTFQIEPASHQNTETIRH